MKVGKSVQKAIDEWLGGDLESAMLHACNAVDGTAKKSYPNIKRNQARFTKLLRDNYGILGPMGAPGIDLVATEFPVGPKPKAPDGKRDIADVIYRVHRCTQGHGDELPEGFELIPNAAGPEQVTNMAVEKGKMRISDRMIFALLAVAVFSPVNMDQHVPDGYFLRSGATKLLINEWWGRAADFPAVAANSPMPSVKLDFGDWMD